MSDSEPTIGDQAPSGSRVPRLAPTADSPLLPYADLRAPRPAPATPPVGARWLAFAGILLGGLLGGLIGWGVADLLSDGAAWPAVGGLAGGVFGAVGVGIVAGLTLRAMNEWRSVRHPEAHEPGSETGTGTETGHDVGTGTDTGRGVG